MSGTITQPQRDRGLGTLLGEGRKSCTFRPNDVRAVWFYDLTEGATVGFDIFVSSSSLRRLASTTARPWKSQRRSVCRPAAGE